MLRTKTAAAFKNAEKLRHITLASAAILLSFIATGGEMFSYPSPVNVIVAALSGSYAIYSLAASALSYIISGSFFDGVANLCSIATIIAVRLITGKRTEASNAANALMPAAVYLLYSAVISLVLGSDVSAVLYSVMCAVICFSSIYSARVCFEKYSSDGVLDLGGITGMMIALLFIISTAALTSVSILGMNLGRAFAVAVIYFAANKYKQIGGAVYGALAVVGVIICSTDMAKNTLLLAVAGLLCGAFANIGVAASVAALAAAVVGGIFIIGTNGDSFCLLADVTVGTVGFLCLPDNRILSAFRMIGGRKKSPEISCHTASSKISFASKELLSVKEQIELVTGALEQKTEPCELPSKVRACVCRDCSRLSQCWGASRDRTASAFTALSIRANSNGAITSDDISAKIPFCCKKTLLCNSFNMLYMSESYEEGRRLHMKELRELLCSQLSVMSDMLTDLSEDTGKISKIDALLSDTIADIAYRSGIKNAGICAYISPENLPTVVMYISKNQKPDMVKLNVEISEAALCDFDMPVVTMAKDLKKLVFSPRPYCGIEFDTFSKSAVFGDYSGDCFETLRTSPTRQLFILSDGMGTGKRARLDSMFTVSLVTRLLSAGFSPNTAAVLINSVLRVKSWEESFATLDIADINLSSGSLELLKCGAAESYLLRKRSLNVLDAKAFPLGILSGASPERLTLTLERGDILILASDGAERSTLYEALSEKKLPPKPTASDVVKLFSKELFSKPARSKPDDVTLIAIKIV